MNKKTLNLATVAVLALSLSSILLLQGCSNGTNSSDAIQSEYKTATAGYLNDLQAKLTKLGDFSLADKTVLKDKQKMTDAKTIVEGTIQADTELFDAMKGKIDELKSKNIGSKEASSELQKAYDALTKDFQDLKDLDKKRGEAMTAYLDFAIVNGADMNIDGDNVYLKTADFSKQYAALEKAAKDNQQGFNFEQSTLFTRHDTDLKAFADALAKM